MGIRQTKIEIYGNPDTILPEYKDKMFLRIDHISEINTFFSKILPSVLINLTFEYYDGMKDDYLWYNKEEKIKEIKSEYTALNTILSCTNRLIVLEKHMLYFIVQ